jgi:mannose-1-phosphate guanylyltransferase
MSSRFWSVVLAAGAGRRLAPVTGGIPKQFWRVGRGPSLLEQTLARIAPFASPERTVIVVDRTHEGYVQAARPAWTAGRILYQPQDRGTAAGVMLALTPVIEAAPDAVVLLTPSDHGVADTRRFRGGVLEAASAVWRDRFGVVLCGVESSAAHPDYGWITRGGRGKIARASRVRPVAGFVEKPAPTRAAELLAARAVWNTMVLVARLDTLVALYELHVPRIAEMFAEYRSLPQGERAAFLARQYRDLEPRDFSRDVLTPAQGLGLYTWPASMGWSDLGTPERLAAWLTGSQARNATSREPDSARGRTMPWPRTFINAEDSSFGLMSLPSR